MHTEIIIKLKERGEELKKWFISKPFCEKKCCGENLPKITYYGYIIECECDCHKFKSKVKVDWSLLK